MVIRILFLEDLQLRGFVMWDRIKQLDFAHMSLSFRALGRFHALSFALRDQRPEDFMSKIATLKEPLFRPDLINNADFIDRFKELGKLAEMVCLLDLKHLLLLHLHCLYLKSIIYFYAHLLYSF